ncbi:cyclic nucleotide-binding domain-containing protein [candidate division CSSED10-310 bacterium]|uniref:Cyclic nucleotide-binding domain-containing protein n=1 Tax=candidate division CSSED10-310 bacterium TaxID=2855610 RepID=A0ABV6YYC9_UNCC1
MLDLFLKVLETVHTARTEEEREAIYKFRYEAYTEQKRRDYTAADHKRGWFHDDYDHMDCSTVLYTGTLREPTATMRLLVWSAGQVPSEFREKYTLDRFPEIEKYATAEISPVVVRPSYRGKLNLTSLMFSAYKKLAGEGETDIAFLFGAPGQIRYYRNFGALPYGGSLIEESGHMHIPLVLFLSDYEHLKRSGSLFASQVRKYFGPKKRKPLDISPFRHLLLTEKVEFDHTKVWSEVQEQLLRAGASSPIIDSLPEKALRQFIESGFLLDLAEGDVVVKKGAAERELYIILDGVFEVYTDDRPFLLLEKGDLFGEIAFFTETGERSSSVRAMTKGKVLVLKRDFLREFNQTDPDAGYQLFMNMGRILAQRLAATTRTMMEARDDS